MTKITKFILSILLVYVCVTTIILLDTGGACLDLFSRSFCHGLSKWLLLVVPCMLFGVYLLWEKDIVSLAQNIKQQTRTKPIKHQRPPQRFIGFFESLGRFLLEGNNFVGRAQRSEFWWVFLPLVAILAFFVFCVPHGNTIAGFLWLFVSFPLTALWARRLHDVGVSAKIFVFPYVWIAVIALCAAFGTHVPFVAALFDSIVGNVLGWIIYYSIGFYVLFLLVCALLPSKFYNNKYANVKESEHHNKQWIIAFYVVYIIKFIIVMTKLGTRM